MGNLLMFFDPQFGQSGMANLGSILFHISLILPPQLFVELLTSMVSEPQ
jgi:hypothetical protein